MSETYNLTYEIQFEDTDIKITKDNEYHQGFSLDTVFGEDRLRVIENNSFYFYVTIDARCVAEIYWNDEKISNEIINEGWSLGTSMYYEINGVPNPYKGPETLKLKYAAYKNDANEDYHILVLLKVIDRHPTFDARAALETENLRGRGSTGIDEGPDYMVGNLRTLDTWNWNNGGTLRNTRQPLEKQPDDSYSWNWTFQTNTGNYTLDSFIANGTACTVPFVPSLNYNTGETRPPEETTKTTILPAGTNVTIEYVRCFNNDSQRVYSVTFSKAYVDLILTSANLMSGTGAPEVVIYDLKGIKDNIVYLNDSEYKLGNIITSMSENSIHSLKFRVKDYYDSPVLTINDKSGTELVTIDNIEQLEDNYYSVSDVIMKGFQKIGLIYIKAVPMKFILKYDFNISSPLVGDDDNDGQYFTIENSQLLRVFNEAPIDPYEKRAFNYWKVGEEKAKPGQIFEFADLAKYAQKNNEGIYEIIFTAQWK